MEIYTALSELATILGITSSLKQLMKNDNLNEKAAVKAFMKTATPLQLKEIEKPEDLAGILSAIIIDDRVLEQLLKRADKCVVDHVTAIDESGENQTKVRRAGDLAHECICNTLREVKYYNEGKLPHGKMKKWWRMYGCKD